MYSVVLLLGSMVLVLGLYEDDQNTLSRLSKL
jgi:hypothetical protein